MIFLEILFDKMKKNMMEVDLFYFMEPIVLKGLHRDFSPNCELF